MTYIQGFIQEGETLDPRPLFNTDLKNSKNATDLHCGVKFALKIL